MPDIKMTPKHPVIGVDKELICKNDTVTYFDKNTRSEYTGIVIDIFPKSNTVLLHEINNEFEKRVDAYACKLIKTNKPFMKERVANDPVLDCVSIMIEIAHENKYLLFYTNNYDAESLDDMDVTIYICNNSNIDIETVEEIEENAEYYETATYRNYMLELTSMFYPYITDVKYAMLRIGELANKKY